MKNNQDLIIQLIIISLILVFFGKTLGQIILAIFESIFSGKDRKKNIDLDRMIERKKQFLRETYKSDDSNNAVGNRSVTKDTSRDGRKVNRTHHAYKEFFKNNNSTKDKNERLKVLSLFDSIQWGEGEEISSIKFDIEKYFSNKIEITTRDIMISFKTILNEDTILSLRNKLIPTFDEVKLLIKSKSLINNILFNSSSSQSKNRLVIAKYIGVNTVVLNKSFLYFMCKNEKNKDNLLLDILENKNTEKLARSLEIKTKKYLVSSDKKTFISMDELVEDVKAISKIFIALTQIPPITSKSSKEDAYKALGIDSKLELKDITKRYKSLISDIHPDRFAGMNLPSGFIKVATDNFSTVQNAYSIIKKSKS